MSADKNIKVSKPLKKVAVEGTIEDEMRFISVNKLKNQKEII